MAALLQAYNLHIMWSRAKSVGWHDSLASTRWPTDVQNKLDEFLKI